MGTKNDPGKFDCYSRAEPDEPMFVLLARDPIAAMLVALWADTAASLGKEEKAEEARQCAWDMAEYAKSLHEQEDLDTATAAFLKTVSYMMEKLVTDALREKNWPKK